ncbi:hypothetical protein HDU93_006445, partial [Gonapodya sp. JEL0774]
MQLNHIVGGPFLSHQQLVNLAATSVQQFPGVQAPITSGLGSQAHLGGSVVQWPLSSVQTVQQPYTTGGSTPGMLVGAPHNHFQGYPGASYVVSVPLTPSVPASFGAGLAPNPLLGFNFNVSTTTLPTSATASSDLESAPRVTNTEAAAQGSLPMTRQASGASVLNLYPYEPQSATGHTLVEPLLDRPTPSSRPHTAFNGIPFNSASPYPVLSANSGPFLTNSAKYSDIFSISGSLRESTAAPELESVSAAASP